MTEGAQACSRFFSFFKYYFHRQVFKNWCVVKAYRSVLLPDFYVEQSSVSFAGTKIPNKAGGAVCLLKVAFCDFSRILVKGGSVLDLIVKDSSNLTQILVFLTGILGILQYSNLET